MVAGHMITVMSARRPRTYMVCESCPERAVTRLRQRLGAGLDLPLSPMPVSDAVLADHGLKPGEIKLLHL